MSKSTWLVLGSSLSAPDYLKKVSGEYDISIATNVGINLLQPDYYFLSDKLAISKHLTKAIEMQKLGMKLIMRENRLEADINIELGKPKVNQTFVRGEYVHPRFSGLICMQFAINSGATKILVVGHGGYNELDPGPDVHSKSSNWRGHSLLWIPSFMQSMVNVCPDIQFVFYGDLTYTITGNNASFVK